MNLVAARTDPVLAEQIERVEPIVTGALIGALAQLVPSRATQKDLRDLAFTAMDALRGSCCPASPTAILSGPRSVGIGSASNCGACSPTLWAAKP